MQSCSTTGSNGNNHVGPRLTAAYVQLCVLNNALNSHARLAIPIQQLQALAFQPAVWGIACLVLFPFPCNDSSLYLSLSNFCKVTAVTSDGLIFLSYYVISLRPEKNRPWQYLSKTVTLVWKYDHSRSDIVTEQELSHTIATKPHPSHEKRTSQSLMLHFRQEDIGQNLPETGFKSMPVRIWLLRKNLLLKSYRFNCRGPVGLHETSSMVTSVG